MQKIIRQANLALHKYKENRKAYLLMQFFYSQMGINNFITQNHATLCTSTLMGKDTETKDKHDSANGP